MPCGRQGKFTVVIQEFAHAADQIQASFDGLHQNAAIVFAIKAICRRHAVDEAGSAGAWQGKGFA